MLIVDVEQGSQEWLRMRLGKITGTRLKEVFKSDNLPLIDENQIDIPNSVRHQKFWSARIEVDDLGSPKLNNGFVNLIGIKIPEKQ
jgi:hypothetical protein